jgi:hypothetical protein
MPGKMAKSNPWLPLGLPEVPAAVCAAGSSCQDAWKAQKLTPLWSHPGKLG